MRITIVAPGSRGDVQPFVALGKGLSQTGHTVRLTTHDNFEPLVEAHGLEFWPLRGDVQHLINTDPKLRELTERGNFIALSSYTAKLAREAALQWAQDGLAAGQGVDLIAAGIGGVFSGLALAEKLDLPFLQTHYAPFTPTRAFPGVLLPRPVPAFLNRLSHHAVRQMMWQGVRGADNAARASVLNLPRAPFFGPFKSPRLNALPVLYGYSPSVIPPPPDWGDHTHVTGYWFLDERTDWSPPPALLDFLAQDPPPVYIGFGSMGSRKPEQTAALVLEALAISGQRAILLAGWSGLQADTVPDSVRVLDSVPHAWLFPRVAAVVHHGGAGTTAAGLRAGVPSLIIPFFGDQPFWGRRVADLGVGPEPIPRKQLTAANLAEAITQAVTDQTIRQRAAELGAQIQAEDGLAEAAAIIGGLNL